MNITIMEREEAVKLVYKIRMDIFKHLDTKELIAFDMAIEALSKPKTGKWIKATGMMPPEFHGHHCCSECGAFANMEAPFGNREDLSDYCPYCGARMKDE